ncbi:unnamed protein product [Rotaria sp. Silwood2]|nr:unnamed protein product [Rotaria sp. Silwood2]CAF2861807.1 unnamed protein product [Rotaria sp. Silwood2]CAF4067244.1 unnamed protein product [Rotaria sp. Silwood2]CAF4264441.1 unnamed protein product [Rotaria sp. Silwood2]
MVTFLSKLNNRTPEKIRYFRFQLRDEFHKLKSSSNLDIANVDKICSLILTHGIDLEYDTFLGQSIFLMDSFFVEFISRRQFILNCSRLFRNHLIDMFKALIISHGYRLKCEH